MTWEKSADYYSAPAKVSRLKFKHLLCTNGPDTGCIMRVAASMLNGHVYLLGIHGDDQRSSQSRFHDILFALLCCSEATGEPRTYSHNVMLAFDEIGASRFFDTNLGEFEIGQSRLQQFFYDWVRHYGSKDLPITGLYLYEITEVDSFAKSHKHLGRNHPGFT